LQPRSHLQSTGCVAPCCWRVQHEMNLRQQGSSILCMIPTCTNLRASSNTLDALVDGVLCHRVAFSRSKHCEFQASCVCMHSCASHAAVPHPASRTRVRAGEPAHGAVSTRHLVFRRPHFSAAQKLLSSSFARWFTSAAALSQAPPLHLLLGLSRGACDWTVTQTALRPDCCGLRLSQAPSSRCALAQPPSDSAATAP
jgi:hypothetical protein